MPAIHEHRRVIDATEIDGNRHANNVAYVAWMQDAAVEHSSVQGWPPDRYAEQGVAWIARSHTIEYLAEAFLGETIVVRTWVADMRKVTSRRRYRIERDDGTLLATAETNWAFIDTTKRSPRRIPPEVAKSFEVVASPV